MLTVLQKENADIEALSKALFDAVPHVKHLRKMIAYLVLLILHRRPAEEHKDLIRLVEQQSHNIKVENMARTMAEVLIEQGFVEGYAKTIAESVAKGIEPNLAHGVKLGIEQGKILAKQENIIKVLYSRFSAIPDPVRSKIHLIHDIARLDTIFD